MWVKEINTFHHRLFCKVKKSSVFKAGRNGGSFQELRGFKRSTTALDQTNQNTTRALSKKVEKSPITNTCLKMKQKKNSLFHETNHSSKLTSAFRSCCYSVSVTGSVTGSVTVTP